MFCSFGVRSYTTGYSAGSSGPVVMSELDCRGNENSLAHCPQAPFSVGTCPAQTIAGVECYTGKYITLRSDPIKQIPRTP